jgi:hypothetical protein
MRRKVLQNKPECGGAALLDVGFIAPQCSIKSMWTGKNGRSYILWDRSKKESQSRSSGESHLEGSFVSFVHGFIKLFPSLFPSLSSFRPCWRGSAAYYALDGSLPPVLHAVHGLD